MSFQSGIRNLDRDWEIVIRATSRFRRTHGSFLPWRLSQIREDLGGSLIPISIFVTLCRPRHAFRPR